MPKHMLRETSQLKQLPKNFTIILFSGLVFRSEFTMIKGENLKIASIGSSSCAACNILILPHITPKGTFKLSASTGHFFGCSVPLQRPRNHVGQNT